MKTNRGLIITVIALLSIIVLLLAGILGFAITSGGRHFSFDNRKNHNTVVYDESYNTNNVSDIIINSDYGDITIKQSNDDKIRIVARGGKTENINVSTDDNKLKLNISNSDKITKIPFYNDMNISSDIDIYLPDNVPNHLEIHSNLGDVDIDTRINTNLEIHSDCGDISAVELCGSFDIHTDLGDIDIKRINISKNSSAATNLGDIDISHTNAVNIDYSTSLGTSDIKNNNTDSNITLEVSTDLGDIEIND